MQIYSSKTPTPENPTPMYHQIRQTLEHQILIGNLPLGAQLPTEKQLCERYKVSRITARRTLNELQKSGVIERTRGRGSFVCALPEGSIVESAEVAILSGYSAKALSMNDENWGFQILRSIDSQLLKEGFRTTLLPFNSFSHTSTKKIWKHIDALGSRLAGVVGFASLNILPILDGLDQRDIPWVTVNLTSRQQTHNFVSADNFAGGQRVGYELAKLVESSALYISTEISSISNMDKFYGFLQGWFEGGKGIESVHRLKVTSTTELNKEEALQLSQILNGSHRPSAVFCSGDILASIVLKFCQQSHLTVPQDIVVIGATGIMLAEHTSPTLTTLNQPMEEIGLTTENMLIEMICNKKRRIPGRYIPCSLTRRESCPIGDIQ